MVKKSHSIDLIDSNIWLNNNREIVDKYNLTKVIEPMVELEDVLEYCRIFDEEVVYAKDYHSK